MAKKTKSSKDLTIILALLFMCTFFCSPLFHPGLFRGHETPEKTLQRITECIAAVQSGSMPPRWAPDFAAGYGMPFFIFYPPLFIYIGAFLLIITDQPELAIKLSIASLTILSVWGMYAFSRIYMNRFASLASATAFMMFPYRIAQLYVRGAYAEFSAGSLLPLIFLSMEKMIQKKSARWRLVFALLCGMLMLAHNVIALMSIPLIIIWLIIKSRSNKLQDGILNGIIALLGIFSASYFWAPAIYEMKFVQIVRMRTGYFDIRGHFAYLCQIFGHHWGLGPSIAGPDDILTLQLGVPWLIFSAVFVLASFRSGKRSIERRFCSLITVFLVVINIHSFQGIWNVFPGLQYSQFPWRSYTLLAMPLSVMTGYLIEEYKRKIPPVIGATLLCAIFIVYSNKNMRASMYDYFEREQISRESIRKNWNTSTASDEYMPKWYKITHETGNTLETNIFEGSGTILDCREDSGVLRAEIDCETECSIEFARTYYPGWRSAINGIDHPVGWDDKGLLLLKAPPGKNQIQVWFSETKFRVAANAASLLSLVCLIWIVFVKRNANPISF